MTTLTPTPKQQFLDANGNPLSGGKVYTYAAGTTTPLVTYTDESGTTPNTNPVILDSRGEAAIWLGVTSYKFKLTTSTDVEIWTVDNIVSASSQVLTNLSQPNGSVLVGYLSAWAGAVATTVQAKLRETISVKDFGAVGDGITDDTAAIQTAINSGAKQINFPSGTYKTTAPLYLDGNQKLLGAGSVSTIILKTTATVGSGSNLARSGTITDSYAKNAILILRHADNNYNYNTTLEGIQFKSDGYVVQYGIYAPRMTHAIFKDVYIMQCQYGFVTNDAWLNTFTKVISNCNSVDPAGVPAVAASSYGWTNSYAFWWQDDGSGGATGTSLSAIDCWARDCTYGWYIYGLQYSSFTSCAADNISSSPWRIRLSKVTLNGCGTEKSQIGYGSYSFEASYAVLNSCQSQTQRGSASGTTAGLFVTDSSRVIINSCQFDNFTVPNATFNTIVQLNSVLINNVSLLPTNGNSYISFSGTSQLVDNSTVPPSLRSSVSGALTRYVQGRIRDNEVIEKADKAILSAGTVIATFTCAGGAGPEYAAARIKICWYDSAFATAIGVSDVQVVCNQDSATNYRQAINTSVNVGAGNGYTTPPTYSIARVGNVWSVTMTPAHGDCTARTITAEVENVNGFTVALP